MPGRRGGPLSVAEKNRGLRIAAQQRVNTQVASDPHDNSLHDNDANTHVSFGKLTKGWGSVVKDLAAPVTDFVRHPSISTGVGLAAAFPWGARSGHIPRQWDAAAGGQIERATNSRFQGMAEFGIPPELKSRMVWHPPEGTHPPTVQGGFSGIRPGEPGQYGYADIAFSPENSFINMVAAPRGGPKNLMIDLLAPAIARARNRGIPMAANPVNPKIAMMSIKYPGSFSKETREGAHYTMDQATRDAISDSPEFHHIADNSQLDINELRNLVARYVNGINSGRIPKPDWAQGYPDWAPGQQWDMGGPR